MNRNIGVQIFLKHSSAEMESEQAVAYWIMSSCWSLIWSLAFTLRMTGLIRLQGPAHLTNQKLVLSVPTNQKLPGVHVHHHEALLAPEHLPVLVCHGVQLGVVSLFPHLC